MTLHWRRSCIEDDAFSRGEDDEDIPSVSTTSPIEDVAVQDNSNEVRLGPMTRSRTKLIEQQVNSFLVDCDNLIHENFILPKSMHLCMIQRYVTHLGSIWTIYLSYN